MSVRPAELRYSGYDGDRLASGEEYFAGGTDLVPLMRSGVHVPDAVVDVKSDGGPESRISPTDDGWRLGARATLASIEDHDGLADGVPMLAQAAASAATRQIRNRATIAGNLLQRSRCSYYRDAAVSCWLKGGEHCPARTGLHEHHAVVDTSPCITTHPSDPAVALVAGGATVTYEFDGDTVTLPVEQLLADPTDAERRLHRLPDGALVRQVDVPRPDGPSVYLKAMDRAAWQFALVGVAAVRSGNEVVVVAGGIAPTPRRLDDVGAVLGDDLSAASIRAAADAALDELVQLPAVGERNRYKLPLLRGLVLRALEHVA